MVDDHHDQPYNIIGGDLMSRVVLSNFEKYLKKLNKDQLKTVIKAACGKNSDICLFKSIIDDSLILCDFYKLQCDICPYNHENDCFAKMVDQLMEVDDIC